MSEYTQKSHNGRKRFHQLKHTVRRFWFRQMCQTHEPWKLTKSNWYILGCIFWPKVYSRISRVGFKAYMNANNITIIQIFVLFYRILIIKGQIIYSGKIFDIWTQQPNTYTAHQCSFRSHAHDSTPTLPPDLWLAGINPLLLIDGLVLWSSVWDYFYAYRAMVIYKHRFYCT